MPLYSLIALVLSVFGATYTALGALRSYYDGEVRNINELVDKQVAEVQKRAKESSIRNANKYARSVKRWAIIWKWSYSVPIVFFLCVVFLIGIFSLISWDKVIHPLSFLAAQTPPLNADEMLREKESWEKCCRCGWWLLFVVMLVNGICSILALLASLIVRINGRIVADLYTTAEETYAVSQVEPE